MLELVLWTLGIALVPLGIGIVRRIAYDGRDADLAGRSTDRAPGLVDEPAGRSFVPPSRRPAAGSSRVPTA